jgi:hypothetical protein
MLTSMKISRLRARRRALAGLLIGLGLVLLLLATVDRGRPAGTPDAAHLSKMRVWQSEWLEKHPVLLRISRSQINGVPGNILTTACWRVMKVMKRHHSQGAPKPALAMMSLHSASSFRLTNPTR